jgi:hypothetical protein
VCNNCGHIFNEKSWNICKSPPPAIRYEFKPMEWEHVPAVRDTCEHWKSKTSVICKHNYPDGDRYEVFATKGINMNMYDWTPKSLDEAKASAEKYRQGLIEKLGGVRV